MAGGAVRSASSKSVIGSDRLALSACMTERMTHLQYLPPEMPVSPQSLQRQGGSSVLRSSSAAAISALSLLLAAASAFFSPLAFFIISD